MSTRAVVALEVLGVVLILGGIAAGVALLRDHHIEPIEAGFVGGVLVFGALLVAPARIAKPLGDLGAALIGAWKGTKP